MNQFIEELKKVIASNQSQKEMDKAIDAWNVEIGTEKEAFDYFINALYEAGKDMEMQNLPMALQSLYQSPKALKVIAFCVLLETTMDDLPYIPNLENIAISHEKLQYIYNTLAKTFAASSSGIGDCVGMILLNNDPKLELAEEEDRAMITEALERKLVQLCNYMKENGGHDEITPVLSVLFDMSTYIYNEKIGAALAEFQTLDMPSECKLFFLKTKIHNHMGENSELVKELINYDAARLFKILSEMEATDLLAGTEITQEKIARSEMTNWLLYPTECGDTLEKIEYVDSFIYNEYIYFIYRYSSSSPKLKEKGDMIAITGGYNKDALSNNETGHTFSDFDSIEEDYQKQALDMVHMLEDYWRSRAAEYAEENTAQ